MLINGSTGISMQSDDVIHMVPLTSSKPFLGSRAIGIDDVQLAITIVISVILFVMIVTGNLMVLLAISCYKKLQNVTNCFVGSLAVSDFLVGLLAPFTVLATTYPDAEIFRTDYQCIVPFAAFTTLLHASITNLTAVTVDRYIAITHPFVYQELLTKRRAKIIICGCWSVAFLVGFILPFFWNGLPLNGECNFKKALPMEYYILTTLGVPVPNILVIIILYVLIWRVAHDQAVRISEESCAVSGDVDLKVMRAFKKERKATLTIAIIVLVFLFCWLPLISFLSIDIFSGTTVPDPNMAFARVLLALLAIANSGANPIVYAFRLRNFRVAFWKIVTRSRCCRLRRMREIDFSSEHGTQRFHSKESPKARIPRWKSEDLFKKAATVNEVPRIAHSSPNLHIFVVESTNGVI